MNKQELQTALKIAIVVLKPKAADPVAAQHFHFRQDGLVAKWGQHAGGFQVEGEIQINIDLPLHGRSVKAKRFASVAGALAAGDLTVAATSLHELEFEDSEASRVRVATMPSLYGEAFASDDEHTGRVQVSASELAKAVKRVAYAMAKTERLNLIGVNLRRRGEDLWALTTDGHRLGARRLPAGAFSYHEDPEGWNLTIPARIVPALSMLSGELQITPDSLGNVWSHGHTNAVAARYNALGRFPDVWAVLPRAEELLSRLHLASAADAIKSIGKAVKLAQPESGGINLRAEPGSGGRVVGECTAKDGAVSTVPIAGATSEGWQAISLNSRYLVEVLALHKPGGAVLHASGALSPVKVTAEADDDGDEFHIIMPIRG